MNGLVISLDPVLVHVGPFMLRYYSLFFALAIVAAVWLGQREARRRGFPAQAISELTFWSVAGGVVFARLFHVIDRWDAYVADPLAALAIWNGGLAVYGGLVGGVLTGLGYALWRRLPAWPLADAAAPAMILGQGLGRLACIPNGDAIGAPASVPWAFVYTNPASMVPPDLLGVPLHPYPVYEMGFDLALFGVLWLLRDRAWIARRPGTLFLLYVAVYSLGRFALSFYRIERIWFAGLQEAQVLSLAGLVVALALIALQLVRRRAPLAPSPAVG